MAINLARYVVTIHADWTAFRREVRTEAARLGRTGFDVRPNLDLTAFRAQYRLFEAVYLRDRTIQIHPNLNQSSLDIFISQFGAAGQAGGRSMASALASPTVLAAIAAAAATLAPVIGAAITGGILLAVGGGVLAAGIAAAAQDPRIQAAFSALGSKAKQIFKTMGEDFKEPLLRAVGTFATSLERIAPTLRAMSAAMAPLVDKLAPALADMVENILPGLEDSLKASIPLFEVIADKAPALGTAISEFFSVISEGGPGAKKFLEDVFDFLIFVLPIIANQISLLSGIYETQRAVLSGYWAFFQAIWGGIRDFFMAVWNAISSWFTANILPTLRRAVDELGGYFARLGRAIAAVVADIRSVWDAGWAFLRDRVFNPLINFVTQTLPAAFRRGVDLIGFWWNALRELARQPVAFVVNQVINPLIRGYNSVASRFGGATVAEIRGFAEGGHFDGRLPGPPSDVDNMLARGPGGRPLALASGEYVVNARQTAKHLPLLRSINSGIEGFAPGGLIGDFFDFITNPLQAAREAFGGPLAKLSDLAGTSFGQLISAMPRKIFDLLVEQVKKLFTFGGGPGGAGPGFPPWPVSPGASRGDSGVWKSILALIRSTGPVSGSFGNAYRHGDPLWHGCVPMDTLILTRRGWIRYEDVRVGEDETVGYNPATGRSEWTLIVGMHHYDDAELWTIEADGWKAEVTPGHKWLTDDGLVETRAFTASTVVRVATRLAPDVAHGDLTDGEHRVTGVRRTRMRQAEVFCPTTTLGTWTAKQGNRPFLTGNSGRAVDWMGYNQDRLAGFFMAMRPRVLELIHTTNAGGYYITRGQRRASMGRQDALHRNHIHIAMAGGGVINEAIFGVGKSGRTYSLGERGREHVTPAATMDAVVERLDRLTAAVERIVPGFGMVMNGSGAALVQMGRSR